MSNQVIKFRDVDTNQLVEVDIVNRTRSFRDESGKLVTMDLGQSDVHIDRGLANYASGYKHAEAKADEASPIVTVPNASDKYWKWDKDDVFQQVTDIESSPGGIVKEVTPRLSSSSFSTVNYAIGAFIPTEVEANADSPLQPAMSAMRRCMNVLIMAREMRVATMFETTGSYTSGFTATIASGAKWNGGASSNPVQDIYTQIEAALMPITDIFMSERTYHDFVQNSAVQKYIASKINVPGTPLPEQITGVQALLGLPKIHVCAMKTKSATAGTYGYVWANDVVLVHKPAAGIPRDGQDISSSYTFRWSGGNVGDATVDGGFVVRSFFNQFRGPRGGRQIVVTHNDAEVLTSDVVSGLIHTAHQ